MNTKYVKNTENALRLLEWLDNGAPHTAFSLQYSIRSIRDYEYTLGCVDAMDNGFKATVSEECGTVCCIAGAASQMADGSFGKPASEDEASWRPVQEAAIEWLGIDLDALPQQFDTEFLDVFSAYLGEGASGPQAAQAFRNFIETGDPHWEEVL